MKRVLSQEKGRQQVFHHDHNGVATIESKTDVSGILKANQYQRDHDNGYKSEVFNHKARIPVDAIHKWCKEKGIKYAEFLAQPEHIKKFLNNSDNAVWLTRKGKV